MATRLGRFELVRKLATGGMADVFLALQWGDGAFVRPLVLKRLHAHLAERAETLLAFENEAKLMALLSHPGVPHIVDFRRRDGAWLLAMEHVAGPTLAQALAAGEPLPLDVSLSVGRQLCSVLGHVHGACDGRGLPLGIVHADLTPANVVLGLDGRVVLLDFGIASTAEQRAGGHRRIQGTTGYMAPEQVRSRADVDPRADLYQLGVLLFEATTGARRFEGNDLSYLRAVTEGTLPRPSERRSPYPPALEALLLEALSVDAAQRPADAFELDLAFAAFADEHGLDTHPAVVAAFVAERFPHITPAAGPPEGEPPDFDEDTSQHAAMDASDMIYVDEDPDPFEELSSSVTDEEHAALLADLDVFSE